ncbi:type I DNA specificity S subunit [Rhodovulum sulfidophilum]|uniref:Type I DNA specificity S subunit n=1 Tax=Rhodovulum sulfidophilum TaxID=35806 RepID=A0A0D6AZU5_RHOSU|nr:type I DNA specificity S subunit [Rhodovulum sulfidophilum]
MNIAAYPKYESYHDSGVEWVGAIPASWNVRRGKWLFKKMDRPVRPEDDIVTCFRDGVVTLRANRRTDGFTNALKEHGYQGIRKGDLVIHAMDAFAGAVGVSDSDGKSTPVYSACVPRVEGTVNPHFYAYYMRHIALSGLLVAMAKGIRERSTDFRFGDFADLALAAPAIEEQTAIVAFLDGKSAVIDEAVRIKEEQIRLLAERRQILIQQAVTRGLNPAAPMKDSGIDWIGQLPAHWEVRRNFALFRETKNAGNAGLPVLSVSIHSGVSKEELSEEENIRSIIKIEDRSSYKEVLPGDIAYNMMRAWQGGIGAVHTHGMVSPAYVVARPIADLVADYFELLYRTPAFIRQMDASSKGITDFRKRLYWDDFRDCLTIAPPKAEQEEIIRHSSDISAKIQNAISLKESQITALREYKTSLINAAVTGKIKVV